MQVFASSLFAMIGFGVYQRSAIPQDLFASISAAGSSTFAFVVSVFSFDVFSFDVFSSDPLLVFESVALVSTLLYITSVLLRREFEGERDHPHVIVSRDNFSPSLARVGAVIDSHEIRLQDFSAMKARDVAMRNFLAPISINDAGSAVVGNSISFPKKAVCRQKGVFGSLRRV